MNLNHYLNNVPLRFGMNCLAMSLCAFFPDIIGEIMHYLQWLLFSLPLPMDLDTNIFGYYVFGTALIYVFSISYSKI